MKDQFGNPIKIEFAPGCFDSFEGTQEELDALIAEIQEEFNSMTPEELAARSQPLDEAEFDQLPEEAQMALARVLLDPEDQQLIPTSPKRLQ